MPIMVVTCWTIIGLTYLVLIVAQRFFTDSRSGYGAGWVMYSIVDFTYFEIYLGK
ncbi:hypothetical protein RhiirB3_533666 [Rhizophagus irregularis]|nr:hypothetical protein RhiirB3_533666 [Rhizophagus irregularis]